MSDKQLETRREFLQKMAFWRKPDADKPPTSESDSDTSPKTEEELRLEGQARQAYDILEQRLNKIKIKRRLVIGVGGLLTGGFALDQLILGGRFTRFAFQFVTDPDFRQKVADVISSGELGEKLENVIHDVEQEGQTSPVYELGETLSLQESWLDQTFSSYTVRKLESDGQETDRLMLVAALDKVQTIESHVYWLPGLVDTGVTNFTETQKESGPFASLPSNQVEIVNNFKVPRMYSAYQLEDGSVQEYFEKEGEPRKNRGGGLVLLQDHTLIAVPNEQLAAYQVGQNCLAIETVAFSVSSAQIEDDLETIDQTPVFSGVKLSRSPRYDSVIATFQKANGEKKTQLISTYQHMDTQQRQTTGDSWQSNQRMTVRQAAQVCEDLRIEGGWQEFVMTVPDPEEESQINGPDAYDVQQVAELAEWTSVDGTNALRQSEPNVPVLRHRGLGEQNIHEVKAKRYFLAAKK